MALANSKTSPSAAGRGIRTGAEYLAGLRDDREVWTKGKRVADVDPDLLLDLPKPTPVPTTSIYSKQDGVVPWEYCMEMEEDSIHQNIEVRGSHLGMANNPSVLKIITNRLMHSRENWEYFYPDNVMEDLLLYPSFR
jgi:hypothetical protein